LKVACRQRYQDDIDRTAVDRVLEWYRLELIKLKSTSETEIYLSVLVVNLDKMCSKEIDEIDGRFKIRKRRAS